MPLLRPEAFAAGAFDLRGARRQRLEIRRDALLPERTMQQSRHVRHELGLVGQLVKLRASWQPALQAG